MGCGWAALLVFVFLNHSSAASSSTSTLRTLFAGAMFLGGPAIGLIIAAHQLNAGALTIALALTPVAVAIGVSAFGPTSDGGIAGRIWPGLAAVTGLLLILVQPNLGNTHSDIALILAPVLTGLGAALYDSSAALYGSSPALYDSSAALYGSSPALYDSSASTPKTPSSISPAFALLGATALFTFATAGAYISTKHLPHISLLAIAYEGVLALLSVLTLSRLGATRWSSQFTWLPLLILLQGILLVRPPITSRWLIGLALLAIASIYLLVPQADDPDAASTLLPAKPAQD